MAESSLSVPLSNSQSPIAAVVSKGPPRDIVLFFVFSGQEKITLSTAHRQYDETLIQTHHALKLLSLTLFSLGLRGKKFVYSLHFSNR